MQIESFDEPVQVEAVFGPRGMRVVAFTWQHKRRLITRITGAWNDRDGALVRRCFAVTDGAAQYELRFEPEALRWRLTRVGMDG